MFWTFSVVDTNSYMMYNRTFEEEKTRKKEIPKKWTHVVFIKVFDLWLYQLDTIDR